jgi:anthranilate phosphoribosyltransferase
VLTTFTEQLLRRESLSPDQVSQAVAQLTEETVAPEDKAALLTALAQKGETVEEIAGFARELRDKSLQPPLDAEVRSREILDVCGTGGDHLGTINISTTVALVAAAAGITVAKHGNRAITSQSGSADVLEALGIRIDLSPEEAAQSLKERNFAFFFAQKYHPAFKHIAPARKLCAAKGQRTIFNLLGPLLNPARPTAQLVGVPRPAFCEPVARVLQSLGMRRAMVVSGAVEMLSGDPTGRAYLDELSIFGENVIAEFYQDRGFHTSTMQPSDFPVQKAQLSDLAGGSAQTNAAIIRSILQGNERGAKRDAILLNSAAALFVAGKTKSLGEGWSSAADVIDSGKAIAKLEELVRAKTV